LNAAPAVRFSSGESVFSVPWNAESSPDLPRKRAFAFSSDAASLAAANSASARSTMASSVLMGEAGFDLACDLGEGRLIHHREIGKHLAIDLDVRLPQARHEGAVGHAELAHRGVDPRDPERAELALLLAAVAVGVL